MMDEKTLNNATNVMVVDDSAVIRGLLVSLLNNDPDINVVGTAASGPMAVSMLKRKKSEGVNIDIATLDVQMPGGDGLEALSELLKEAPDMKVIMASTLTSRDAAETVRALSLGAADYLAKPQLRGDKEAMTEFNAQLLGKIKSLSKKGSAHAVQKPVAKTVPEHKPSQLYIGREVKLRPKPIVPPKPDVIAIASSTGGPQALNKLFGEMKGVRFNVPILVTQHMPAQFTRLLAEQIGEASGLPCKEADDGEEARAGTIYIAPGDYHMIVAEEGGKAILHINQEPPENFCRPAADPMLRSIARTYGGKVLVIVLTGMGSDGALGCYDIVDKGGIVIAQDKESSIVWGMPGAVATSGLCTEIFPLDEMREGIMKYSRTSMR